MRLNQEFRESVSSNQLVPMLGFFGAKQARTRLFLSGEATEDQRTPCALQCVAITRADDGGGVRGGPKKREVERVCATRRRRGPADELCLVP